MVLSLITTKINPVFGGKQYIVTTMQNYPIILNQIVHNINAIPNNVIKDLSNIHNEKTKETIRNARFHPESNAKNVLLSHIELKDNNSDTITITAIGDVDIFFEYGVRPHLITPSMISVAGYSVAEWLSERGLNGMVVGGSNSSLRKPGIRMMELGFNEADKNSLRITDEWINRI